jgi:non-canonical poly(A) RNA polymerase PAPD5/7
VQINYLGRPQEYIDEPFANNSLGILLKDFLWYYGSEFPYSTAYIDIEKGLVLPRSSEEWVYKKRDMKVAILCPVAGSFFQSCHTLEANVDSILSM